MSEEIKEIRDAVGAAGTDAGAVALVTDAMMAGGAGTAVDAALAGTEIAGGAALGGAAFAAASVVGAGALGYEIGSRIDEATGASDTWSSSAVAADPSLARSAAEDWDNAGAAWDRGDHLEAIGEGAESVGKFVVGSAEAAADAVGDAISDAAQAVKDLF